MTERVDSDALPATARDATGLHLEIRPTGSCWVSATADGQLVLHRLLQSGENVTIKARDELVLRVGDPRTFVYRLNGSPGRRLGRAPQPVTVHVTEDTYETFLIESAAKADQRIADQVDGNAAPWSLDDGSSAEPRVNLVSDRDTQLGQRRRFAVTLWRRVVLVTESPRLFCDLSK